jgi:hypothetical protein
MTIELPTSISDEKLAKMLREYLFKELEEINIAYVSDSLANRFYDILKVAVKIAITEVGFKKTFLIQQYQETVKDFVLKCKIEKYGLPEDLLR